MRGVSKKRKKNASRSKDEARPVRASFDFPTALAAVFLAAAFAGAALAFDSGAESSFDAPKRIVSLFAIAAAALAAFGFSRWENPFSGGRLAGWSDRRISLVLVLLAAVGTAASAAVSPHRPLAVDSLRAASIVALLPFLGASRLLPRRTPWLLGAFFAAMGIDAVVSILQARGLYQPFPLVTQGIREATGAFAGNVGYLALALAFAAVAAAGIALTPRATGIRIVAAVLALLYVAALIVNRNLTSLSALAAGLAVSGLGLFGRRAILPFAGALVAVALAVALYTPMRHRAGEAYRAFRARDWDTVLSYRTGAWAAAARMARERPLLGWGPGTFGAEFVRHRLDAEIAAHRRLTTPMTASTYGEAHCDYLQPFAEEGTPVALALLAAVGLVLAGLVQAAARTRGTVRIEAILLLGFLAAGATAALTWFPLQRPITALPLLLAAGRAWRIGGARPSAPAPEETA